MLARIVLCMGMLWTLTVSAQSVVPELIVFGDSLSDNGNSYEYSKHTKPPEPLYYHGRYSNGPIWVDYVRDDLFPKQPQALLNYAFGGATILPNHTNAFTLSQEIDSYLSTHPQPAKPEQNFVIWIGANDYLANPEADLRVVAKVINQLEHNIKRLLRHRAQHVMIIGMPDLGVSPFAHDLDVQTELSELVKNHNRLLKERIVGLQKHYPSTQWHFVDVNEVLLPLFAKPKQFGFAHVFERCVASPSQPKSNQACRKYVFFDQIHPTTQVHKIFAQKFMQTL
jgi:phospholipase/lecithinase/hemolysin